MSVIVYIFKILFGHFSLNNFVMVVSITLRLVLLLSLFRILLQKPLWGVYVATGKLDIQKAKYLDIEALFQCMQNLWTIKPLY